MHACMGVRLVGDTKDSVDVDILCLVAIVIHVHLKKMKTNIHRVTLLSHPRERLLLTKPTILLMDPQAQDDSESEDTEYHQYTRDVFPVALFTKIRK